MFVKKMTFLLCLLLGFAICVDAQTKKKPCKSTVKQKGDPGCGTAPKLMGGELEVITSGTLVFTVSPEIQSFSTVDDTPECTLKNAVLALEILSKEVEDPNAVKGVEFMSADMIPFRSSPRPSDSLRNTAKQLEQQASEIERRSARIVFAKKVLAICHLFGKDK